MKPTIETSRTSRATRHRGVNHFSVYLTLVYGLMLVYGTLFPLSGWHTPALDPLDLMWQMGLANSSKSDILANILVYLPFGMLLMHALPERRHPTVRIVGVTLLSTLLSLLLEYSQAYLPGRVPSLGDWILNTGGGFTGALLSLSLRKDNVFGDWLNRFRSMYFQAGPMANIGLLIMGLWALSQLSPLVPSIDLGNLRQGIKPLWATLQHPASLEWLRVAEYSLGIAAIGLISLPLSRIAHNSLLRFAVFATLVLLLKIPVVGRQISLESLLGLIAGVTITTLFRGVDRSEQRLTTAIALTGAVVAAGLYAPSPAGAVAQQTHTFNWVPFRSHLSNDIVGIIDILGGLWPFLALSYLALQVSRVYRLWIAPIGAVAVFLTVFALEWAQQGIPGRSADITDAVIAMMAWVLPWLYLQSQGNPAVATSIPTIPASHTGMRYRAVPAVVLLLLVIGGLVWQLAGETGEQALDESTQPLLPAPAELPPAYLPNFHYRHPRLPAPKSADIARMQQENPRYLSRMKRLVTDGKENLDSSILVAYVEPGSVDLRKLHKRLMALEISWRGHSEAKPVAVAYDWLYDQWSTEQRNALRNKLLENANYLIRRIREEQRLSPYNVYLYNSPLQALMATSLALYGDDKRGDVIMNFVLNYWKTHVLPVWGQIMGSQGGWHEGGEYVGIGIGQAVYQLPALWRAATGEDLFRTESGIRGFLDFLVYRIRPDGSHFRWGDGAFFNKKIPDQIPLAIEYRHAAAYSLFGCRHRVQPTSWPWGPLPDKSLCDPEATKRLPLTHYFDGIGLLVARSDWTDDATYVSFKAGDNYWSHTHLDQGAFTIYKGGPLAIDSGAYGGGGGYDSDHHMNYSYQTIAHNTITVTDPDDTVPAPREDKPPRRIANDGGQRRIGSGWGINAAPLDLHEWLDNREIYHTGTVVKKLLTNDLAIAVSDITPAYTNEYSGKGTFSHRTRRVERLWRTFGYDSKDGVVVVFDQLRATQADFRKRWLLHSMEHPVATGNGFLVTIPPGTGPGRRGGRLEGHILLPEKPVVEVIGGKGAEFLVDGTNYDENGALEDYLRRRNKTEAGEWRIEISPTHDSRDVLYLVVMLPSRADSPPSHSIRMLRGNNRVGCEITGPARTTRWWFTPGRNGAEIEIETATGTTVRHPVWAD